MAALGELQKAVDDLYEFRDLFFEDHSLEEAAKKDALVEQKMKDTLKLLEPVDEDKFRAQKHYLEGKSLNVTPVASQQAVKLLERAVKLDPKLTDAWNQLGECYWKSGKPLEAKNCFLGALQHEKNKISLRNLSIVLRNVDQGAGNHAKNVKDSLDYAKEAVSLDIADGQSWAILGNAYMSLFFIGGQDWEVIDKALAAFSNAEKDKKSLYSPDLHYNRASLYRYTEDYSKALEGFQMAARLDPGWPSPHKEADNLVQHLKEFQSLIESKGKMKAKQVERCVDKLKQTEEKGTVSTALEGGAEELTVAIVGHSTTSSITMSLVCVDREGVVVGVSLYNVADGKGPLIGDSLRIPQPKLTQVNLDQCGVSFTCISIRDPSLLSVNGRTFPKSHLSPTAFTVTAPQT